MGRSPLASGWNDSEPSWDELRWSESAHKPWLTGATLGTITGASAVEIPAFFLHSGIVPVNLMVLAGLGTLLILIGSLVRRREYRGTTSLGSLTAGLATFFSPLLGLATAFGPSVVSAWPTRRALRQLQAASRNPELVQDFFAAHPALYKVFLTGPFQQAFVDEKHRAEDLVQQLRARIARYQAHKTNPIFLQQPETMRTRVIAQLDKKIAECGAAVAQLQADVVKPIEAWLKKIPGLAEQVDALMRQCDSLATVEGIVIEAARARLGAAAQETMDVFTRVTGLLAANTEVTGLLMRGGGDPLADDIDALGTEVVEGGEVVDVTPDVEVVEAGEVEVVGAN